MTPPYACFTSLKGLAGVSTSTNQHLPEHRLHMWSCFLPSDVYRQLTRTKTWFYSVELVHANLTQSLKQVGQTLPSNFTQAPTSWARWGSLHLSQAGRALIILFRSPEAQGHRHALHAPCCQIVTYRLVNVHSGETRNELPVIMVLSDWARVCAWGGQNLLFVSDCLEKNHERFWQGIQLFMKWIRLFYIKHKIKQAV